jgi:DNA-binding MarR family transcriptional regulator
MKVHNADDVIYLLRRTGEGLGSKRLSPNQRLVVILYASSEQTADGTVVIRATELAATVGMTASVLSRTRKELVELGWLEESGSVGRVKLYRLNPDVAPGNAVQETPRSTGHLRVVSS